MKLLHRLSLLSCLAIVACVTINIYFPAEEVRHAADRIVNEVWGEHNQPKPPATTPAPADKPQSQLLRWLSVRTAEAAQDINVSTPEIRAIKQSMKARSGKLFPFLDSGNIGIGANGLLKVRTTDGLGLRERGLVTQLVQQENADRKRLYQEIAVANGFPDKADEVQSIFAGSWRDQAAKGWYLEQKNGSWVKK